MENILDVIQSEIIKPNNFADTSLNPYQIDYANENEGQLEIFPNPPVKWPCALIDLASGQFTSNSNDRTAQPQLRQQGVLQIEITIANKKITNSSGFAPATQKDKAYSIWKYAEVVHKKLQGFRPMPNSGALVRSGFTKVKRDDGIQEIRVIYTIGLSNC